MAKTNLGSLFQTAVFLGKTSGERLGADMIRSLLLSLTGTILVVVAYSNIWNYARNVADGPVSSEIQIQEHRYKGVRDSLVQLGYFRGNLDFMTNRDLLATPTMNEEDGARWAQAQYVMVPWILLHDNRSVSKREAKDPSPFVIGDFWDQPPLQVPAGLVKVYESSDGLMLFQRNTLQ